uniref:Uncharacterized protein n=1 Tax=Siphoviridae sp. ctCUc43 TaxID=2825379 RepID=A0A8S5QIR5_9CAUD|nr:MAG TPA: hypothetical protein [Siphoviridae sp. ctCUc43]
MTGYVPVRMAILTSTLETHAYQVDPSRPIVQVIRTV